MRPIRKVVFPVAGLGTRFLPATKAVPKEMLPVVDRPLIQYAVEEAFVAGCTHFIFVSAPGKEAIERHFAQAPELEAELREKGKDALLAELQAVVPKGAQFDVVFQGQPLGLGHAVGCAEALVGNEPFAVILPDEFMWPAASGLTTLVAAASRTGGSVLSVLDVPRAHTSRYGIVAPGAKIGPDGLVEIKGFVEKPKPEVAPSTLAAIGRYVLEPEVFAALRTVTRGAGGEIQLTDAIAALIGKRPLHALPFAGRRFDCGDKLGYVEANLAVALDRDDLGSDRDARLRALLD